jgi:PAS domain S-box-containing protein
VEGEVTVVPGERHASAASEETIRLLHLEDDDRDAELVAAALASQGFDCRIVRVTSEAAFRSELKQGAFDLILADYALPSFDGLAALRIAREVVPHVPFIILSGTLGEELAIETLKTGATDYVLKDRLSRLGPSMVRALRESARARENQLAAKALRDNQTRLDFALRAAGMGVWSWEAEEDSFRADERMRQLLGVASDACLARISDFLDRVHPEDRDGVESEMLHARDEGSEFHVEYRLSGDGRHLATRGQFLHDPLLDGDRALGVSWDVTGVKQEEQQSRLLSTVLESAINAVMITDADGRISWVNPAFTDLTGYSLEEVKGENPRILKSGKHDDAFYQQMWDALSRGNSWNGKIVNRRKDGSLYTEETVICPVRGAYGETSSYVCMKRDITLEVDLARQLHQAQRLEAVGRLAGGIAHDFNNILTVISGNADLSLADLPADDPMTQSFQEISDASRRAASLTRQLLAFSRKQILQPRVLNLNELVTGTEKMLRRLIGEDVKLKTIVEPHLGAVMADPGQIEQILMNLAVNARDAMPRGGELCFETENVEIFETQAGVGGVRMHSGSYAKLTVTDTGEGMDEETLSRIFEPFFTTKEKGKGTGLGLATVYGIVKQSGGFIFARSEPGKGTSFEVYLPQTEEPTESAVKEVPALKTHGGETVLVVEDEEVVLKLARSILVRAGYNTITARNGAEAIRIVEVAENPIHLLLTDVVMPGMSGRALADGAQSLHAGLRVLFTSGYTDDAILHHGVLDAGTHLLQKPYSRKTLLSAVRTVLDGT